jgi:hypothetical protein
LTNFTHILALDPSGNFNEGKGTTGYCLFDCVKHEIIDVSYYSAKSFRSIESYWDGIISFVAKQKRYYGNKFGIVIEDYLLYGSKVESQINSRLETPKFIGALQYYCYKHGIHYTLQPAGEVKSRWADSVLHHKKFIEKRGKLYYIPKTSTTINEHCRDAIRHAVHYATFKNKKGDE